MPFQFLGTSGAIPSAGRDNTALAFYSRDEVVLVDCPGSPYRKLLEAGLDPMRVSALIVTHRHVDHLYGVPSLVQTLGLAGRRQALTIYAIAETLAVLRGFWQLFPFEAKLPYRIELREIPSRDDSEMLHAGGIHVRSSPVVHGAPSIGLRVAFALPSECGIVVYSGDTSPCASLIALARGADVLIHEATFLHEEAARARADGHTTGYQAGEVAAQAGVKRLFLCHFAAPLHDRLDEIRAEARQAFDGPVEIPEEFREYRADGRAGNGERGTGNGERGTGKGERGRGSGGRERGERGT